VLSIWSQCFLPIVFDFIIVLSILSQCFLLSAFDFIIMLSIKSWWSCSNLGVLFLMLYVNLGALLFILFITNLTCDILIMKIVQSSYILHKHHALKTHFIRINVLTNDVRTYDWTNVIGISHLPINSCVNICFRCMILACEMYESWMSKFCTIYITMSWDVKFVMLF